MLKVYSGRAVSKLKSQPTVILFRMVELALFALLRGPLRLSRTAIDNNFVIWAAVMLYRTLQVAGRPRCLVAANSCTDCQQTQACQCRAKEKSFTYIHSISACLMEGAARAGAACVSKGGMYEGAYPCCYFTHMLCLDTSSLC